MAWHHKNRDLIAAAIAAVALLVLEFGLRLPPLYALALAAATWLGVWLLLAPSRPTERVDKVSAGSKVESEGRPSAGDLQAARAHCANLQHLQKTLEASSAPKAVCRSLASIVSDCQAMLSEASASPQDFRHDRRALLHFLPQVVALLEHYQDGLERHDVQAADDLVTDQRLQATLERLAALFGMFRRRKAERATRALNVQIDVLEAQLRQEGLSPHDPQKD